MLDDTNHLPPPTFAFAAFAANADWVFMMPAKKESLATQMLICLIPFR
jgi:hypothetical protein